MKSQNNQQQYDNFERQIKKRLESYQTPYQADAWQDMEALLDQQNQRKIGGFWRTNPYVWTSIAAAILLTIWFKPYPFAPQTNPSITNNQQLPTTNSANNLNNTKTTITSSNSNIIINSTPQAFENTTTNQHNQTALVKPNNTTNQQIATQHNKIAAITNLNNNALPPITHQPTNDHYSTNYPSLTNQQIVSIQQSRTTHLTDHQTKSDNNNNIHSTPSFNATPSFNKSTILSTTAATDLPILQSIATQHISTANNNLSIIARTTPNNVAADMPVPKRKKRFLVGIQTAFAETFNNKNNRTTNNFPIGITAEYRLNKQFAIESGINYSTQRQFTETIDKRSAASHLSYSVKSIETKNIELPLLVKYYFPSETSKFAPYVAVGTGITSNFQQNYRANCNCNFNNETSTNSSTNTNNPDIPIDTMGDISNVNEIEPTTEHFRYDLAQIHLGTQYALGEKWALQAQISYKTNLQPIYIRNNTSKTLLVEPYQNKQTALHLGLAYRF